MKIKSLILGMIACAAFSACSSDDADVIVNDNQEFKGDAAYMNVRLSYADNGTRAVDGGFEYGVNEQAVKTAHFYFYDAAGQFVTEASVWNDGTAETGSPAGNIEFKGNTVVALKGLTSKNYPKYVVTVLNRPTDFVYGNTLAEMGKKLSDEADKGIMYTEGNTNYFVMSTTSFKQPELNGNYFVTEVTKNDFYDEPVPADASTIKPVEIFVERLAAKVKLNVAVNNDVVTINNEKYYKIKATVAGEGNVAESGNNIGAENLYVHFLGWKLNGTAKKSYMMKNIDESWTYGATDWDCGSWTDAYNHRSYWAKSFNYGNAAYTYPSVASNVTASTDALDYVNLNGNLLGMDVAGYCPENTNNNTILAKNFPSAVTSVLIKAEICDEKGTPLDLVRFNGVLFKQSHFLKYVLNSVKSDLPCYEDGTDANGNKKYTQIDESYVEVVTAGNGYVKVAMKANTGTLYNQNGATYTKDIATILANASAKATGYKGGLMYYSVPIQHYNNADVTVNENTGVKEYPEGKYGVVRNHLYSLSIETLENPGKGIFDPEETIIPNEEDEKFYYVGARINILSWKIVNQSVGL